MIAPARRVAYRFLLQIQNSDAHSDELLRLPAVDALTAADRNLATMLVLGTLRWQLELDARIRPLLARPNVKLSPEVATSLRMGAFQLLHLERVPAHAVINDSVELVKHSRESGASGMVNAVLRKIAVLPHPSPAAESSAREIAGCFAHPVWMVERWARRYGLETAEAICRWDQEPAGTTIRMVDAEVDLSALELEPGAFLTQARRVIRGDVGRSAALRQGQIRIQDEASQLVAEMAAAAGNGAARVLDTCAAPGGKTAVLAERLLDAEITALDVSRKRVLAAEAAFARGPRGNSRVRWQTADVTRLELQPQYGLVLCDVPCSGTGTMARNPEIRLRVEERELARQHARQVALLRSALAGLARGGRLVYSTCSLEPEENEAVIDKVQSLVAGLRRIPVAEILDGLAKAGRITDGGREQLRSAIEGGYLRTIPGVHPCDGFFAAVIERN